MVITMAKQYDKDNGKRDTHSAFDQLVPRMRSHEYTSGVEEELTLLLEVVRNTKKRLADERFERLHAAACSCAERVVNLTATLERAKQLVVAIVDGRDVGASDPRSEIELIDQADDLISTFSKIEGLIMYLEDIGWGAV
jgi:hypothetical protein